jgi:hypothetical protein
MSHYQPTTLKNRTVNGRKTKVGFMVRTNGERVDITVDRSERGDFYLVTVNGLVAGKVHVLGVGRWGIQSFGADSKPTAWQMQHQSRGYVQQSPLDWAVDRVVGEFVCAREYAQQKPAEQA